MNIDYIRLIQGCSNEQLKQEYFNLDNLPDEVVTGDSFLVPLIRDVWIELLEEIGKRFVRGNL